MGLFSNDNTDKLYEEALDLATVDDEECVRCYDKILEINPNEGMAWRGKALALGRLGQCQNAITCFDEALKIDPYDDVAQRGKDIELEELAEYDDNIKNNSDYETTTEENPLDILKVRFAKGEITKEEFQEMKELLD